MELTSVLLPAPDVIQIRFPRESLPDREDDTGLSFIVEGVLHPFHESLGFPAPPGVAFQIQVAFRSAR